MGKRVIAPDATGLAAATASGATAVQGTEIFSYASDPGPVFLRIRVVQ